jgi:hypothetical protein
MKPLLLGWQISNVTESQVMKEGLYCQYLSHIPYSASMKVTPMMSHPEMMHNMVIFSLKWQCSINSYDHSKLLSAYVSRQYDEALIKIPDTE